MGVLDAEEKIMSIEEKTNEIVEFLRPRLEEALFLYAYQVDGKVNLRNIREKVYEELTLLEKTLGEKEKSSFFVEKAFDDAAKNIAFHINMSLDAAFLATKKDGRTFFLPSFLSYSSELSEKIKQIEKKSSLCVESIIGD